MSNTTLEINEEEMIAPDIKLDINFFDKILAKINQLISICKKSSWILLQTNENLKKISKNISLIKKYILSFNDVDIIPDELVKSFYSIDRNFDSILKLFSINNLISNNILFSGITKQINKYIVYTNIFISNISEISHKVTEILIPNKSISIIKVHLVIESILYNYAARIYFLKEYPFMKSKFVGIYQYYEKIHQMNDTLACFKSFWGTGKSIFLPLILLCRSLKNDMKTPFLIISQSSQKQSEYKYNFLYSIISKYATFVNDPKKLEEIYNEYEKSLKIDKIVVSILSPDDLLRLMYNLRGNDHFYPNTRFIIDEIYQRSIYLDVLISKIALLNTSKPFKLPLNVLFTSASINPSLLKPFRNSLKVTNLVNDTIYEVTKKSIMINKKDEHNKISDEIVKTIEEMATIKKNLDEGHILCYFPNLKKCLESINLILESFSNSKEEANKRKIVFLQTKIRHNEKAESYLTRLYEEFMSCESMNGKNCKHDVLYFAPFVIHENLSNNIIRIVQNEFPNELKKINKFICSTPMIDSSLYIDDLSVVIDSGFYTEEIFDYKTGKVNETKSIISKEIKEQRRGKLGHTMKGRYISYDTYYYDDYQIPSISKSNLTKEILFLKSINIDFEKMENLPTKPNFKNLCYSMDSLMEYEAIDDKTYRITPLGIELAKYSFLPIEYSYTIINDPNFLSEQERNYAKFLEFYIATIITIGSDLILDHLNEKLKHFFNGNSDIITLVNVLNKFLMSDLANNDQSKETVESFGLSYYYFSIFMNYMQRIVDNIFPNKTIQNVITEVGQLIKNYTFSFFVEKFINDLIGEYPEWEKSHYITFQHIDCSGSFNSKMLIYKDKNDKKIYITNRPGWKSISIPCQCYCFNNFIHKKTGSVFSIQSVLLDENISNPWFKTLMEIYFRYSPRISLFTSSKSTTEGYKVFCYSMFENKLCISFEQDEINTINSIRDGIQKCLKLTPFIPKSILIYRNDVKFMVEIMSIGTQQYDTRVLRNVLGNVLTKKNIDYCLKNIDELSKSYPSIRICALFTGKTCLLNEYDENCLYFIDHNHINEPLLPIVMKKAKDFKWECDNKDLLCLLNNYLSHDHKEITNTLSCCEICEDPNNPTLTKYPISVYFQDGSIYTNKMCRECIVSSLQYATSSFFKDGEIDQDGLVNIFTKLSVIPTIPSTEIDNGKYSWPQIPIDQLISVLIKDDSELSSLISAWLMGVSEYSLRTQARDEITFCPDHPQHLYNINEINLLNNRCQHENCRNIFCFYCMSWHDLSYKCAENNPDILIWDRRCPKCKIPVFKDGGCNHIACRCGHHWCFKCG
ncbi:hypothetical protein M9Y10_015594 [Tritrichomonas musculus]|uniref:RING-type domain-containing protein n=1 Tax=Tritrichomonas musculus TaxID=1915356 RepID=A0ABR2L3R5_9EUKA